MKLYGGLASPYVARVAMQAKIKGLDLPIIDAPGGPRSDEYKTINPLGKIPALEHDDNIIVESEVICEYLEEIFPGTPVLPSDPLQRAHSRMISRMVDLYVAPINTGLFRMRDPANRDQVVIDEASQKAGQSFAAIERFVVGPYLAGEELSVADCALVPFILMLKANTFSVFEEIIDPTIGDRPLAAWWAAIEDDPVSSEFIDDYQQAFDKFMIYLREMMSKR